MRSVPQRHPRSHHHYDVSITSFGPEGPVGSSYAVSAPNELTAKNRAIKEYYKIPALRAMPIKKIEIREEEVGE